MIPLRDEPLTPEDEARLVAEGKTDELIERTLKPAVEWAPRASQGKIEAGELLSIVYGALVKAARNFVPSKGEFLAFSKPFIRFAIFQHWKDEAGSQPLPGDVETTEDFDGSVIIKEPACVESDAGRDTWELLQPELQKLSEQNRQIIELYYGENMSFTEIARKWGVSKAAVSMRHQWALRELRSKLASKVRLFTGRLHRAEKQ